MVSDGPGQVTRLSAADIPAAVEVLLDAFSGDPLLEFFFPKYGSDQRQPAVFYGATLEYVLTAGEIYAAPGMAGVAAWYIPHGAKEPQRRAVQGLVSRVKSQLDAVALGRIKLFTESVTAIHREVINTERVYLEFLAVRKVQQGKGTGARLLKHVLEKADGLGLPCLLDTMNPKNPPFYRAHGFEVVHEGMVCKGGPYTWTMLRQPRKSE